MERDHLALLMFNYLVTRTEITVLNMKRLIYGAATGKHGYVYLLKCALSEFFSNSTGIYSIFSNIMYSWRRGWWFLLSLKLPKVKFPGDVCCSWCSNKKFFLIINFRYESFKNIFSWPCTAYAVKHQTRTFLYTEFLSIRIVDDNELQKDIFEDIFIYDNQMVEGWMLVYEYRYVHCMYFFMSPCSTSIFWPIFSVLKNNKPFPNMFYYKSVIKYLWCLKRLILELRAGPSQTKRRNSTELNVTFV